MNHSDNENTQCSRIEQLPLLQAAALTAGSEERLSVLVIYQDPPTRSWATELCQRVGSLVGPQALNTRWWNLDDLNQPALLAGAVSTALRADVLIVSVRAAEGFPLPFYVWVHSWLPHHRAGKTALVALVAYPDQPSLAMARGLEYLRAIARQARLDFLLEERRLPLELPDLPTSTVHAQVQAQDQAA